LTGSLTIWVISHGLESLLKHISPTPYRRCFSRLKLLPIDAKHLYLRWKRFYIFKKLIPYSIIIAITVMLFYRKGCVNVKIPLIP